MPEHRQGSEAPILLACGSVPVIVRTAIALGEKELGEDTVRIDVPEICDSLWPVLGLDVGQLSRDLRECFVPADPLEPVRGDATHRVLETIVVLRQHVARFALHTA